MVKVAGGGSGKGEVGRGVREWEEQRGGGRGGGGGGGGYPPQGNVDPRIPAQALGYSHQEEDHGVPFVKYKAPL